MIIVIVILFVFGIGCITIGLINRNKNPNDLKNDNNVEKPNININSVQEEKTTDRSMDKIVMTIKEGTLTKTGATIFIKDSNENPYSYGEWYRIDKKEDGKWKELDTINGNSIPEIALPKLEYGEVERTMDWTEVYGELKNGEYRIVKQPVGEDKEIYVEFEIK